MINNHLDYYIEIKIRAETISIYLFIYMNDPKSLIL